MPSTRSRKATLTTLALAALALSAVGCATRDPEAVSLSALRSDPSIALDTLTQRHVDIDNQLVLVRDENLRMMNEDIGRAMLLDHPSRLTPKPIPW